MGEPTFSIKLELGISAQKIIQQVQCNHVLLEEQIQKGIELALDDILSTDNFVEVVRENTKKEINNIVTQCILRWETRDKINKIVNEKIGQKIDEYADNIAERVTKNLSELK